MEIAYDGARGGIEGSGRQKSTGVRIGNAVLFYGAAHRKGAPRWRGTAKISDTDESGATAKFQPQTCKVARYRVLKKAEEEDAEEVEWNPMLNQSKPSGAVPREAMNSGTKGNEMEAE